MITGRQRAQLKKYAHDIKPLMQVGKNGITPGVIEQIDALLEDHELVKITLLQNTQVTIDEAARELTEALNAEFVQAIGSKLTIFRQNEDEPKIQLG